MTPHTALLRIVVALATLVAAATVAPPPAAAAAPTAEVASLGGCTIAAPDGEFAREVSLSAGHARVWRLYQAFFLRQPDRGGFDYWLSVRSNGYGLGAIAYQLSTSAEFQNRYGNLSNDQYVSLVYNNVLCRQPDSGGLAYWRGLLDSGQLSRWDMMVNFVELEEYMTRTGTCHSFYPQLSAGLGHCSETRSPLSQASLGTDGYRAHDSNVNRLGGGTGSFRGVEVDVARAQILSTGHDRCSVASINANWLVAAEKDRANPGVLGLGIVDGRHVKNSSDRSDRGVFGLRFDTHPASVVEVWPGDTLSADDTRLNSVMWHDGRALLEQWYAAAELSPYLGVLAPDQIVKPNEWAWAAAGVPLLVDGQLDGDFWSDVSNDPYTYLTLRHTFVAMDQDTNRLVFGGTTNLTVPDLVAWAGGNGYDDLIKFDGGGSAEFNIGGTAVVAGTGRDIPVWLGVGC
ncbi:MAG: DUF4214 domain-containing protein [Acidimicrobiales bacterium]